MIHHDTGPTAFSSRKSWVMLAAFSLLQIVSETSLAAFAASAYPARSLTSWEYSIQASPLFPRSKKAEAFDPSLTPLASRVEYTGRFRKLSGGKLSFLKKVARDIVRDESLARVYATEIQVSEQGFKYWIAVQRNVFPHLGKELKAGEVFTVYHRFAGVAVMQQPVYLMEEFDSAVRGNAAH